jgi:hypothetical protein
MNKSYCLFVGMASAALYSVLAPISVDKGLSLADLNAGNSSFASSLGFSNIDVCRNWIHVLVLWMGMCCLAAIGITVWQKTCVFIFDPRDFGKLLFLGKHYFPIILATTTLAK